jgi:hypothetical protein
MLKIKSFLKIGIAALALSIGAAQATEVYLAQSPTLALPVTGGGNTVISNLGTANVSCWLSASATTAPTGAPSFIVGRFMQVIVDGTQYAWCSNGIQPQAIYVYPLPSSSGGGAATQSGAWSVGITGTLPNFASPPTVNIGSLPSVTVSNLLAIQPISATALPLPTGAATAANQTTEITSLGTIANNTTGVATSALQTAGNSSLATVAANTSGLFKAGQNIGNTAFGISGTLPAFASTPTVNIGTMPSVSIGNFPASQAVTGTFWQPTQPVSAVTLPLPTGAALDSSVASLSGKFGALGQKAMAGSAPVVIASDQSAIPIAAATLPLPTGAANFVTTQTSVTTTATQLAAARTGAAGVGRIADLIVNNSTSTIFVGGSGVTTANGISIVAGASITLNVQGAIYAIVASGTATVSNMETY